MVQIFIGDIIHTKSFKEFEIFSNGFIAVNNDGKILDIGFNYDEWCSKNAQLVNDAACVEHLTSDQFLMPGFVDCHIHAPQVAQIGLGLDMPLLDWLQTYTFPLEAKFTDVNFANQVYDIAVKSTIRCGTTFASYFGTNHHKSTIKLAEIVNKYGQRALIGKVCSDCNGPDNYVEKTEDSVKDTLCFIQDIVNIQSNLIRPTITPRFALSCTKELLQILGNIAKKHDLNIQSHISENTDEVNFVKSIFGTSYAKVYDDAGLLTKKTIMAHAVHLEFDEIELFRERGTSVAHCPASNSHLGSGFCDVLRLINNNVKVGLGTDVSGGNSVCIKDTLIRAMEISQHLKFVKSQDIKGFGKHLHIEKEQQEKVEQKINDNVCPPLNYKQALYLATLGGAEALSMDDITGNFTVGKQFDALIIDTSLVPLNDLSYLSTTDINIKSARLKLMEKVQRFIYVGDDRNIIRVYVAGKSIKEIN